ncbi:spore-associated protein A [Streptomyces sp. NPDC059814]|uniref:spore-associated protein A n=1 Tax=unclassified Streptomyces TaxID=2593676 RepID=UPI0036599504
MGRLLSRAAVGSIAAFTMLGAGIAVAPSAAAAAAYNGACGSGYSVVNSAALGSVGTVYLTYNSSTKQNCVVTVRNSPGTAIRMMAGLERSNDVYSWTYDVGQYTSYAGPVYVSGAGTCMNWSGYIGTVRIDRENTNCG